MLQVQVLPVNVDNNAFKKLLCYRAWTSCKIALLYCKLGLLKQKSTNDMLHKN